MGTSWHTVPAKVHMRRKNVQTAHNDCDADYNGYIETHFKSNMKQNSVR